MANVSSSNGLEKHPKLRFKGFTEPWTQVLLSDIFKKSTRKNSDGSITNVICNSARNGLIPQREYFDKSIANSDNTDGYYIIEQGDFVYNPRKSSDAPYGPVSIYKYTESGIVSPLYLCFRALKPINSSFYDYFFKSPSWHRYIYLSGDSGARHDRVSIKDDVFFSMPVHIPSEEEQLKVSTFLSLIEKRIADQQQLVEHLKKYKRGVSDKIFSEADRWDQVAFLDVFSTVSDKPYQVTTSEYYDSGAYEVVDQGKNDIVGYNDDESKVFYAIPIIVYGDHTTIIKYRNVPFIVGGDGVKLLTTKTNNDLQYLYYALCQYNIQPEGYKRHFSIVKHLDIPIPSIEKQRLIAETLATLDIKIQKESCLLDKLLTKKKAFLQQLFM